MDLQNVSSLVIPEGSVRTIHDKNNRLLWGKLSYDTKYAGNTVQDGTPTPDSPVTIKTVTGSQTVKVMGKNLFLCPNMSSGTGITRTKLGDNSFKATVNSTDGNKYTQIDYALSPNTTYYFSANISISGDSITHTGAVRPRIEGSYIGWYNSGFSFTTGASGSVRFLFYNYSDNTGGATVNNTVTWSNIQIEKGSAYSSYEPYQAKSYTVNLGSIELCKISDYQDYAYKSGDNWYIHKEIGKVIFDGTETWVQVNSYAYFSTQISTDIIRPSDIYAKPWILSDYYSPASRSNLYDSVVDYGIGVHENTPSRILIRNKDCTSIPAFTTWLSNNNTTVYYPLSTSTDTKITDATLVGQLDAIHQFLTRYGYNATVSGNLPLIIDKTNL